MDITKISKFLALVLRHKPEAAHLSLDKNGWANVDILIEEFSKKYEGFNMETLTTIVDTDNKGRYTFNEDKTLIRANQGHSVNVDVELEVATPPDTLYHGTATKFVNSIKEKGLIPKTRLYVHLSKDIETASNVGLRHGELVIFNVNTKKMIEDGFVFYLSKNGVWLTKKVPPKYLSIIKN